MQLDGVQQLNRLFSTHPLSREEPAKAWMRFLRCQIRSRLHTEVVFQWIGGQSLLVRRGMTGATGNICVGLHEFSDMMVALHFLREGDLFLDIGANVGSYSVLASGVCRARSWAFEPDSITAEHLRRNLKLNRLESSGENPPMRPRSRGGRCRLYNRIGYGEQGCRRRGRRSGRSDCSPKTSLCAGQE